MKDGHSAASIRMLYLRSKCQQEKIVFLFLWQRLMGFTQSHIQYSFMCTPILLVTSRETSEGLKVEFLDFCLTKYHVVALTTD